MSTKRPSKKAAPTSAPDWLVELGPTFLRDLKRLSKKFGITEAALMRKGLDLAKRQQETLRKEAQEEATLFIEDTGETMPMSRVKAVLKAAGRVFGGKTTMSSERRKQRAQTAAAKRWENKKKSEDK